MERQVKVRFISTPEITSSDDLIFDYSLKNTMQWILGEQELLGAVIVRAVQDLELPSERENSIEWIRQEADEDDPWTLPWICDQLNWSYKYVLNGLNLIINGHRPPPWCHHLSIRGYGT